MPIRGAFTALLVIVATLALATAAPQALADGDPASDFLITTPVYYPYQPPTSSNLRAGLENVLSQLRRGGLDLKVAIIGSFSDLGAANNLWGKPQAYASFLGREISFNQKQPLLVVMPTGFGLFAVGPPTALGGLPVDAAHRSNGLARSAIAAVLRIAHADGKAVSAPTIGTDKGSGKGAPALLVFGAPVLLVGLAALLARARRPRGAQPEGSPED